MLVGEHNNHCQSNQYLQGVKVARRRPKKKLKKLDGKTIEEAMYGMAFYMIFHHINKSTDEEVEADTAFKAELDVVYAFWNSCGTRHALIRSIHFKRVCERFAVLLTELTQGQEGLVEHKVASGRVYSMHRAHMTLAISALELKITYFFDPKHRNRQQDALEQKKFKFSNTFMMSPDVDLVSFGDLSLRDHFIWKEVFKNLKTVEVSEYMNYLSHVFVSLQEEYDADPNMDREGIAYLRHRILYVFDFKRIFLSELFRRTNRQVFTLTVPQAVSIASIDRSQIPLEQIQTPFTTYMINIKDGDKNHRMLVSVDYMYSEVEKSGDLGTAKLTYLYTIFCKMEGVEDVIGDAIIMSTNLMFEAKREYKSAIELIKLARSSDSNHDMDDFVVSRPFLDFDVEDRLITYSGGFVFGDISLPFEDIILNLNLALKEKTIDYTKSRVGLGEPNTTKKKHSKRKEVVTRSYINHSIVNDSMLVHGSGKPRILHWVRGHDRVYHRG